MTETEIDYGRASFGSTKHIRRPDNRYVALCGVSLVRHTVVLPSPWRVCGGCTTKQTKGELQRLMSTIDIVEMTAPTTQVREHDAFDFYTEVFADIDELSANRHLLTRDEFNEIWRDAETRKYIAVRRTNEIVGMSAVTNRLDHVPLVSPRYFAKKYPRNYLDGTLWYIKFVGTLRGKQNHQTNLFRALIHQMYPLVKDGVSIMDYSHYNVQLRRLPYTAKALLAEIDPRVAAVKICEQQFWAYSFDGEEEIQNDG